MFSEKESITRDLKEIGLVDELIINRTARYIRLKMQMILAFGMTLGIFLFIIILGVMSPIPK